MTNKYKDAKQKIIKYLLNPDTQDKSIETDVIATEMRVDYQTALEVLTELHEKGLISKDI